MLFQINNVNEEMQITQRNHKIKASRTEKYYFHTYKNFTSGPTVIQRAKRNNQQT